LVSRVLATALTIAVLALLLATPHTGTQAQSQVDVRIRWVTYLNPTGGNVIAYGVCVFSDYIAVAGEVREPPFYVRKSYVALLRKSDGSLVREWIGSEEERLYNCISIDGKLYAVGYIYIPYGVIYVFDVNLNVLARVTGERRSGYHSLAYDGKALYLGGWAFEDVDGDGIEERVWLVEKRALDESFRLVNSKKIHFNPWIYGSIYDIGVEPSTGRVWAVGYYIDSGAEHSLIVILDSDLRELKVIDYPPGSEGYLDELYGITFDGRQHAYITGVYGVAKFTIDGELIAVNRRGMYRYFSYKIVYGYGYLYTFGVEVTSGYWRCMLYIYDTDLYLVKSYVLSKNVLTNSYFREGRPALEGSNIYVAGFDYPLVVGNERIAVYSLSLEGVTVATTTGTEGATATTAETATLATVATMATTTTVTQTTTVLAASPATVATVTPITQAIPVVQSVPVVQTVTVTVVSPTTVVEREAAARIPVVSVLTAPTTIYVIIAGLAAVGIVLSIASLIAATTTPNKTTTQTILIALATTGAILAIILLLLTI